MRFAQQAGLFFRGLARRRTPVPHDLQLEFTNRCRWNCDMCPRRSWNIPETEMPLSVVEDVSRNLAGVRSLGLCGWGETLDHPHFFEAIDLLLRAAPTLELRFTTNGAPLTEQVARRVIDSGVHLVSVSLERLDGQGHGHLTSAAVIANVRRLAALRGERALPKLSFQMTMHADGLEHVREVIDLAAEVGAAFVNLLRLDVRHAPQVPRPDRPTELHLIKAAKQAARGRLRVIAVNDATVPLWLATRADTLCLRTLFHAYVDCDGNVTPCCKLRDLTFGNLRDVSLAEIWNSPRYRAFFADPAEPCAGCDTYSQAYRD